jgi:hypothetical protein
MNRGAGKAVTMRNAGLDIDGLLDARVERRTQALVCRPDADRDDILRDSRYDAGMSLTSRRARTTAHRRSPPLSSPPITVSPVLCSRAHPEVPPLARS